MGREAASHQDFRQSVAGDGSAAVAHNAHLRCARGRAGAGKYTCAIAAAAVMSTTGKVGFNFAWAGGSSHPVQNAMTPGGVDLDRQ